MREHSSSYIVGFMDFYFNVVAEQDWMVIDLTEFCEDEDDRKDRSAVSVMKEMIAVPVMDKQGESLEMKESTMLSSDDIMERNDVVSAVLDLTEVSDDKGNGKDKGADTNFDFSEDEEDKKDKSGGGDRFVGSE